MSISSGWCRQPPSTLLATLWVVLLVTVITQFPTVTEAAFKPGWEPPLCLDPKFKPTNISIENDTVAPEIIAQFGPETASVKGYQSTKFHVLNKTTGKMELFFVRGVGYSPIPPSKYTYSQPFDMFTSEFRYVWERDLVHIKEMGANTVRVWSWDSFRDHSDFLDALYENDLYIMVPFMFTMHDYKDLSKASTRKQVLTDWKAFVLSVMNHPAVLAFLIGNELNTNFGSQRQELFGLINEMIRIRDNIDFARHPVSLPLSDVAFVEAYSNPFFQWSAMEFWSLQTYRPERSIAKPIEDYYYSYIMNMSRLGLPFKPLVLTEFGVDALEEVDPQQYFPANGEYPEKPKTNESKQATFFCTMFSQTRSNEAIPTDRFPTLTTEETMSYASVIGGTIVMEWHDEWWKGMYADVTAPMCPNYRTELHSWCRDDVGTPHSPYYLHEEWLGLSSQIYDPHGLDLCICPRRAYFSMKIAFGCNGNESCLARSNHNGDGFNCFPKEDLFAPCSTKWCAHRENIFLNGWISMLAPAVFIGVVLLVVAFALRRSAVKEAEQREDEKKATRQTMNEQDIGDGTYQQEESQTSVNGLKLRQLIAAAFLKFSNVGTTEDDVGSFCPYFVVAQDRLFNLVWDTYLGFDTVSDQILTVSVRIVYERFMEAYHLYLKEPPSPQTPREDMFLDMALYSIVQTWAGTINHSPEKICEIFEFSKDYFDNVVAKSHGQLRVSQVQDFHHGMVEIFRAYYLKVDEGEFTFEDVNEDALLFRDKRLTTSGNEKKLNFWHQEYQNKPEDDGAKVEPKQQRTRDQINNNVGKSNPELDLLPDPELKRSEGAKGPTRHPFLEYHKLRDPEEHANLLSECASTFFNLHQELVGVRWMQPKEAFPQKGGPFTLMFNYGWIIRYLVWQNIFAKYLQPIAIAPPMCLCDAVMYLAIIDSAWMFLSFLLHYRIIGRLTKRIIFEGITSTAFVVSVGLFNVIPGVNGKKSNATDASNFFGFGYSINTFYLIATIGITLLDEARLLIQPHCATYRIPARFTDTGCAVRTRIAYYVTLAAFCFAFNIVWIPSGGHTIMDSMNIHVSFWPNLIKDIWILLFVLLAGLIPYGVARFVAGLTGGNKREQNMKKGKEEATYLVCNTIFWGVFWAINWFLAFYIFVPSVNNITFQTCICEKDSPNLTEQEHTQCEKAYSASCFIAVIFTWLSAFLVSFVALFGSFEVMLLIFGLARGKYNRVGNVKTWHDVERNFDTIRDKCLKQISSSMLFEEKQSEMWNVFVNALYEDCLLNKVEKERLTILGTKRRPDFRIRPRSEEAIRRITYHLWSLESLLAHAEVNPDHHHNYRKAHRVRTMPTLSVVVPAYNETIIFEENALIKTRSTNKLHLRITEIEYLAHTYPDEWDNLAERLKAQDPSFIVSEDNYPMDLLSSYVGTPGHPRLSENLRFEIRWWATMRGQTLARTMQGFINWRTAMMHLLKLEEDGIPDDEAHRILNRKFQLVISHQTYNANADVHKTANCPHEEAMEVCFRKLKHFDLVFNDDKNFQSICKRLKPEVFLTADGNENLKFTSKIQIPGKDKPIERTLYNYFPKEAFEVFSVQRVGRLKIGEGKAENQMHALQFVNGSVLQAIDMNQYATTENGFKVPYLLGDYFSTPHSIREDSEHMDSNVIPPFRIVGFPEWAYTRSLSLVGELMGSAEWCFVTITQRVLDWPLRIRLHYGHPDFFDCFYVRNRGGQSKASQLVNTNEDIFAGYEMLGRGDRGSFVEFLECQKGRETSFGGAFTFEAKLAQGGAQQCRSFDVYRLNRGLDVFNRFSLFFTSLAFYCTNLLMAVSINYYILSLALFAVSGISYHKLGLLDAVIAVPWLFQIGYTLALPYLVELTIQRGFWRGLGQFLRTLPSGILFFIFHLRTKTYFFTQGLLIGKGGYAGTGRGFGLDRANFKDMYRAYSESHYHEALLIFGVLVVYAIYGSDPVGTYLLRTFNVILIVLSWFWAPIIFNPAPTTQDLQNDVKEILEWITNRRHDEKNLDMMLEKLDCVHLLRVHGLVSNLEAECKEYLNQSEESSSGFREGDAESQADTATLSHFKGMANAFESQNEEDMREALRRAYQILSKSRSQLQRIQTIDNASAGMTLDQIVKEYWGKTSEESWTGWFIQSVVISAWEGEDVFFPGLINLVVQKVYLVVEVFSPWILLCLDQFHEDSVWFLALFVIGVGCFYLIDKGFYSHHEYTALAKGSFMLTVPLAVLFFHFSLMTFGELVWSCILYVLCVSLIIKGIFGAVNARAKFKRFGLRGNPHHVAFESCKCQSDPPLKEEMLRVSIRNRTAEMEITNKNEQLRFSLLMDRMRHIRYITIFRGIIPLIATAWLAVGNMLTVIFSEWVTTLNFNGRVNEAWKKAYLRPSYSDSGDGGGHGGGGGGARGSAKPLTREQQVSQDEAATTQAAVYGSLSSSLPAAAATHRRQIRAPTSRNMLGTTARIPVPNGPRSGQTAVSVGSFHSTMDDPSRPMLSGGGLGDQSSSSYGSTNNPSGSAQPRNAMHFLNNLTDKYRK